jgi:glucan phosphoethanolaminetransferase (alkaline phosphatase superfamily)
MKSYIQGSLVIVSILMFIWGMGILIMLSDPRGLASLGTVDTATLSILAVALLGFSLVALVTAQDPKKEIVYSLGAVLVLICLAAAFHMIKTHNLAMSIKNVISLIVALGSAIYLIVAQNSASQAAVASPRPRATPRPAPAPAPRPKATSRPAPARKKAATRKKAKKKKTAKKKTKARR